MTADETALLRLCDARRRAHHCGATDDERCGAGKACVAASRSAACPRVTITNAPAPSTVLWRSPPRLKYWSLVTAHLRYGQGIRAGFVCAPPLNKYRSVYARAVPLTSSFYDRTTTRCSQERVKSDLNSATHLAAPPRLAATTFSSILPVCLSASVFVSAVRTLLFSQSASCPEAVS
jgi:hypothetical protein